MMRRNAIRGMGLAFALVAPAASPAATATRAGFGTLPDGRTAEVVTLTNRHGVSARIISYGASLQSLTAPDRDGRFADIALGYSDLATYLSNPQFLGATAGRFANRIANGRFSLDGRAIQLPVNSPPNMLHGGTEGFDKKLWRVVSVKPGRVARVTLAYTSADGEESFPGKLDVTATYSLDERDALTLEYRAKTDKPTIVNLTNHSYFNLAGEGSGIPVTRDLLTIPATRFTPVNAALIPTGERRSVDGTPFDFRTPTPIGAHAETPGDEQLGFGKGYDHNFVVTDAVTATPHLVGRVEDPETGRVLEVLSNQPGVQLYTGNHFDGRIPGKSGNTYSRYAGVALEAQLFPDAPNQPDFPKARLDPGRTYRNVIVWKVSTAPRK